MLSEINLWAVLVAAASSFLLGGMWYSPALFGKLWQREAGMTASRTGHPARVFGVSFSLALISALAFAWFLGPEPPLKVALHDALLVGLAFVAACFGINYQFANRSTLLWAIDGGYHTAQFLLFGLVLGLWH
jgi:hypothetical protein